MAAHPARPGGAPGRAPRPVGTSTRSAASPSWRERRPPAGPPPWGWTGGAGCGTVTPPASPQPPPNPHPGLAATRLDVASAVHALLPLVTDVWWATLSERGEIHSHGLVARRPPPR